MHIEPSKQYSVSLNSKTEVIASSRDNNSGTNKQRTLECNLRLRKKIMNLTRISATFLLILYHLATGRSLLSLLYLQNMDDRSIIIQGCSEDQLLYHIKVFRTLHIVTIQHSLLFLLTRVHSDIAFLPFIQYHFSRQIYTKNIIVYFICAKHFCCLKKCRDQQTEQVLAP